MGEFVQRVYMRVWMEYVDNRVCESVDQILLIREMDQIYQFPKLILQSLMYYAQQAVMLVILVLFISVIS